MDDISRLSKDVNHLIMAHNGIRAYIRQFNFLLLSRRYFRERLAKTDKDKAIWKELQRQLDAKRLEIRKGTIQDATFITADPGHASTNTPWGDIAKTRRSKDGTWTKKV
jgi:hypothetical protein